MSKAILISFFDNYTVLNVKVLCHLEIIIAYSVLMSKKFKFSFAEVHVFY